MAMDLLFKTCESLFLLFTLVQFIVLIFKHVINFFAHLLLLTWRKHMIGSLERL